MNRREALSSVVVLLGGTIIGAEAFLSGCSPGDKKVGGTLDFSKDNIAFLDEVGETILPATASSPGAKEAKIGEFMKTIVTDCYDESDHKAFLDGIDKLNAESQKKFSADFMNISAPQKLELLTEIDKRAKAYEKTTNDYFDALAADKAQLIALDKNKTGADPKRDKMREGPDYYFSLMKQLTIWGFFSSKPGATQALRYISVPTRYDGCVPYKKGDKAWAT